MSSKQIKIPKGTRDWDKEDIVLREEYLLHNGRELDTPAFELKSILTDKYGEDSKLIYDLQDQGGEICALRYDLTVPFARWLAMKDVRQIKRFQIGKVYRRDQPAIERGRMREFYQCDFDFAGSFDVMVADAEVLCITAEVFEALKMKVTIRVNHRQILDGIFEAVGVPKELVRPVSSAVDKLDKMSWDDVKKEMETKGLDAKVAEDLGKYLFRAENQDYPTTLDFLSSNEGLRNNTSIRQGVEEMRILLQYLESSDIAQYVQFDLTLARGLDYYTGLIYEVVPQKTSLKVGSIAAGGRYDNLVGMFSKRDIPCVGISFGTDRIITLLKNEPNEKAAALGVAVWIVASGNMDKKMALARRLRQENISTDFDSKIDRNVRKQIGLAEANKASVVIIIEDDISCPAKAIYKILIPPKKNLDQAESIDEALLIDKVKEQLS